jgi:hypothetical protein
MSVGAEASVSPGACGKRAWVWVFGLASPVGTDGTAFGRDWASLEDLVTTTVVACDGKALLRVLVAVEVVRSEYSESSADGGWAVLFFRP